jgi:hypothetical protein
MTTTEPGNCLPSGCPSDGSPHSVPNTASGVGSVLWNGGLPSPTGQYWPLPGPVTTPPLTIDGVAYNQAACGSQGFFLEPQAFIAPTAAHSYPESPADGFPGCGYPMILTPESSCPSRRASYASAADIDIPTAHYDGGERRPTQHPRPLLPASALLPAPVAEAPNANGRWDTHFLQGLGQAVPVEKSAGNNIERRVHGQQRSYRQSCRRGRRGGMVDDAKRKDTSTTRQLGACLRCHFQRVRVSRDDGCFSLLYVMF